MPMTTQLRMKLYHCLKEIRRDGEIGSPWTDAEIGAATKTFADDQTLSPRESFLQAIDAALNPANERAVRILRPGKPNRGNGPVRLEQDEPCPVHGGKLRRLDGEWVCCWQERHEGQSSRLDRKPHPPPPGIRESVAKDLHRAEK